MIRCNNNYSTLFGLAVATIVIAALSDLSGIFVSAADEEVIFIDMDENETLSDDFFGNGTMDGNETMSDEASATMNSVVATSLFAATITSIVAMMQ